MVAVTKKGLVTRPTAVPSDRTRREPGFCRGSSHPLHRSFTGHLLPIFFEGLLLVHGSEQKGCESWRPCRLLQPVPNLHSMEVLPCSDSHHE